MSEINALQDYVRQLEASVGSSEALNNRYLRSRYILAGFVAFLAVYLAVLYIVTHDITAPYLDADEAAHMLTGQLVSTINDFGDRFPGQVKEHAPKYAADLREGLIDYAPKARDFAAQMIDEYMKTLLARLDTDMSLLMAETITEQKDLIRETFINFKSEHEAKDLVNAIKETYREELKKIFDESYVHQVRLLDAELVALATADPTTLTDEERAERRLFCLFNEYLKRARKSGKLDLKSHVEDVNRVMERSVRSSDKDAPRED
ncbi:MAG: hypothetical protein HZA54_18405 [Planctomycetes bacterium]|nr:hypothetical protein [Planctomycetota bacterium]